MIWRLTDHEEGLSYETIRKIKEETIQHLQTAESNALKASLSEFIEWCDDRIPSHSCYLDDDLNLIVETATEQYGKQIVLNIESDPIGTDEEGNQTNDVFVYTMDYSMRNKPQPPSYDQQPPRGLLGNYLYLHQIRINKETAHILAQLQIKRIQINNSRDK